ncbi:MAG: biotin/lipoyl-binding protein [Actinobacteria bacterium]|nr:biotin/lipoyl-binding protein [Actinomycetota bacterium]
MFERVLVANRGEIAVRIIRTLRRLGIAAVAVYSDADVGAPHVRAADLAVRLGPAPATDSYLDIDRVVAAATSTGATALHPGYGFLSEHPGLARACDEADVTFVGPPASAIEAMADKSRARALMRGAEVPVVPGVDASELDDGGLLAAADDIGLPIMVKPVAGGGGKGMSVVGDRDRLPDAVRAARRQATNAFGDDRVLLERFVTDPRHIEVQVLADEHGHTLHLGERECSLQRRHQKIVEEAPSPLLDTATRRRIGASAVAAARACGYRGAGTVEYIVSDAEPDTFFFLEMNTRLQVEHPVTELVTGLDLVEWQLRVAAGETLPFAQDDVTSTGHAIEARVYAEDPAHDFLPTGGAVLAYREPDGVRVDSGIAAGTVVPTTYDPLLAKVIAHAADRDGALRRLDRALSDLAVLGVRTNVGFLRRLLAHEEVVTGDLDTGLVGRIVDDVGAPPLPDHVLAAAALSHLARRSLQSADSVFARQDGWRIGEPAWTVVRLIADTDTATLRVRGAPHVTQIAIDDGDAVTAVADVIDDHTVRCTYDGHARRYTVAEDGDTLWIESAGDVWMLQRQAQLEAAGRSEAAGGPVVAPMPGTVTAVHVSDGDAVTAGQALVIMEAMKMEHQVTAPVDGHVSGVSVRAGAQVEMEQTLLVVDTTAVTPCSS